MEPTLPHKKKAQPRPCPFCSNDQPVFWELPGVYWIQCTSCDATTTMEKSRSIALRQWNFIKYKKVSHHKKIGIIAE